MPESVFPDSYNLGVFKSRVNRFLLEKKPVEKGPPPKSQRPQQSFKRRAEPPRPAVTSPKKAKVVPKVPAKTSGVHDNSSGSFRKPETKKQEEVKKPVPQPTPAPVEPSIKGGYYQLNARMTKMVETELRDIMIKVWHELPDDPTDEAEALVVDKLRNQAGDNLRNVLGLNITKRLLNVHNPLYVKVQFSGKPEKVHLGEFLKKYNFTAFKRIETTVNMFAAQVKTINDFDNICSAGDIRCGDIKVTVNPIYKFTKCPPKLVTSFFDHYENDEPAETTEKEAKPDISPKKDVAKTANVTIKPKEETKSENTTKDKVTVVKKPAIENKAAVAVSKPAVANKAVVKPTVENKAVVKSAAENKTTPNKTTVENKTAVNKPAVNNTANKTPVKPTAEKPVVNKPTPEKSVNKPVVQSKTVTKTAVDNKPVANKTAVVNKSAAANIAAVANKLAVVNKPAAANIAAVANKLAVVNKPAAANKAAVANKPAVVNKPAAANIAAVANKAAVVNKPAAAVANKPAAANKAAAENKAVAKPLVGNKDVKKPAPKPAKTPVKANTDKKSDKFDDNDELDDRDILALISEGIVLDECSGSDEE